MWIYQARLIGSDIVAEGTNLEDAMARILQLMTADWQRISMRIFYRK